MGYEVVLLFAMVRINLWAEKIKYVLWIVYPSDETVAVNLKFMLPLLFILGTNEIFLWKNQ